jgi:hypothetical protein
MNYREHYIVAHKSWFSKEYPSAWADGFWTAPKFPKVATANGLTQWICNFLNWSGHRATRISSAGRYIPGNGYDGGMFIPGSTRKGTADISATIKGRSVMIEVKVGKDRPSPDQLKEQAKERAAGGCYEFIHTPEEFLKLYDGFMGLRQGI